MTDPKTEAETRSAQIAAARAQWEFDLLRSSAPQSALSPAKVNDDLRQDLVLSFQRLHYKIVDKGVNDDD